ncbi:MULTISPECIES: carbohydrate-binding protein [unclassified Chitinophaga]|uniref:carbohydrate-binding protein n=1 Tax=unclassified Chitinophaga TaxID=2619133 RepID=UPI0009FB5581|nr:MULTISPECIES: carbohydrate-binding protein [unclassified Chitinophaga]WPV65170.1 carbohydrate-binding protein [Chitinophaga sp. LS1]
MRPILCLFFIIAQLIVRGQSQSSPPAASPPPAATPVATASPTGGGPGNTPPPPATPAPVVRKGNFETEFKMKSGSYLGFGQVNLGLGEVAVRVTVFCENKQSKGSRLEFRINSPKGKKSRRIGTLKIPYTGDTTYALKMTGNSKYSFGVHDLYLVARGSQFSITAISFETDY